MRLKHSYSSNVVNFPTVDYGQHEIDDYLNILQGKIDEKDVDDWTLIFYAIFTKANNVMVFRRQRTYPSTREKEVSIIVPMPANQEVSWGVDPSRYATRPPIDESKYWVLENNPRDYATLKAYVVSSMKKGIDKALKEGITIKNSKVRLDV